MWNSASSKQPAVITRFNAPRFAEFMAVNSFAKPAIPRASSTTKPHPTLLARPMLHHPRQPYLGPAVILHTRLHPVQASTVFPASVPQHFAEAVADLAAVHLVEVEGGVVAVAAERFIANL